MNTTVVIIVILSAWKWGDWKNWQKYHTTMLVAMAGNLIYHLIYCDDFLWRMKPEILQSYDLVELIYSIVVFPLTALMFLSNYPTPLKYQVLHILKYVSAYTAFEYLFHILGKIEYNNGWNLGWSIGWNFIMFIIWAIHHKWPLHAYVISVLTIIAMVLLFPVQLN